MNDKLPVVSVIVTTYNRENYLKETIQSVLNQTFTDFELIVVDNFSNYDFFKTIEDFNDPRIRAFQNQNNGVIAVNRNFGISKARGKYLAFCDDDDLWVKDKLAIQLEYAEKSPNQILSTNFSEIDERSNLIRVRTIRKYDKKYDVYSENLMAFSSVFLTNSLDVNFDVDPCLMTIEDYALWTKLYHKGYELHVIQKPLIKYRISSGSTFYSFDNFKKIAVKHIYLYSKMFLQYPNIPLMVYIRAVLRNLKLIIVITIKNGKFKNLFLRN